MLRIVVFVSLVLAVVAAEQVPVEIDAPLARTNGGGIQKFNVGKRVAGDKLIWSGYGNQVIDFAKQIVLELPFPQEGKTNNAVITQIVATTSLDAGNTLFAMVNGGVGQKKFTLRATSNYAKKVSYKFEVYGK